MTTIINRALIVSVLVLGASACSNNDNGTGSTGNTTTPAPPVVVTPPPRQEDQFGTAFGTAFRAASDGEPFPVQDGDLVAVSLTAEPVTIN